MPLETVNIDVSLIEGQRRLYAWCCYPKNDVKREAFLAALHFEDCRELESKGEPVPDWQWPSVKALGNERKSSQQIVDYGERLFRFRATVAASILWQMLDKRAAKIDESAAQQVAKEMREYYSAKRERGAKTDAKDVLHRWWAPYKSVAHLTLAFWLVARENLPPDLRALSEDEERALIWKAEDDHPDAEALNRVPTQADWSRVIEIAEHLRLASIENSKITIKDSDTIKFVNLGRS